MRPRTFISRGSIKPVTTAQEIESSDFHPVCEIATELRSAKKFVAGTADISVVVAPTGSDKIIYRTQPLTDKYLLSYGEVIEKVRSALPGVKQSWIDGAIKSLNVKGDAAYSAYNFRTKLQQEKARKSGSVPKGLASIYNDDAVRMLIQALRKDESAEALAG